MKKYTEKPPIDDLFARKLGNMSLPPSSDGFERLQARMGHTKPDARVVVFWRNPAMYGYAAAAACLLLVCLFGWLYWPTGNKTTTEGNQLAVNRSPQKPSLTPPLKQKNEQPNGRETEMIPGLPVPEAVKQISPADQVAEMQKPVTIRQSNQRPAGHSGELKRLSANELPEKNQPVLAQAKPAETKTAPDVKTPVVLQSATPDRVAENMVKPAPTTERVLDVTIAEPEALVAARQAAKNAVDDKPAVASVQKPEKETKAGNLWEQVKRFKQGEVFARQDKNDADRGLLGRAYNGLRQSFDKDKSVKQ